jgi:glycosyltransferase involved in cell wall biosynthesis
MAATNLNVAIVHDWLIGGGAELVVEQLHKLYPEAPIYTSYATEEWKKRLDDMVVTGWLQHFGKIRKFIPFLRIWWFTHLDLSAYDIVISSSGAEAKGIKVPKTTLHINYCHAPTHYYWSRYDEYILHPGFGPFDGLARLGLKLLVGPLKKWDYAAAQRPDYIIANSTHIQSEIQKYYGRDSIIIFPPVYMERFTKPVNRNQNRSGYIISGRQTPYKRFDLAVEACSRLGLPLTVIGNGPDHSRLQGIAGPSIKFVGRLSDTDLEHLFASSHALLFPGVDDFGITPVEAMASSTPVIAFKAGGALDYVVPGVTGEYFTPQTAEALAAALITFKPSLYNPTIIAESVQRFSSETFRRKFKNYVQEKLQHN